VPLSTIVSIQTGTDPNSLTHYNQLNSATSSRCRCRAVTVGAAVDPRRRGQEAAAGFATTIWRLAQYVQEGTNAITFGFALIIIFLVLARSSKPGAIPWVIMISVPMAIVAP